MIAPSPVSPQIPPNRPISPAAALALLAINWLIPGSAFWLRGRWARGFAQFALVGVTFSIGIAFHAGVVWPDWNIGTPNFNLINNIMFGAEMLAGLPAALSLAGNHVQELSWLAGQQVHPYFELGALYLVFAGAINYFGVCSFYDRFLRREPFKPGGARQAVAVGDAVSVSSAEEAVRP